MSVTSKPQITRVTDTIHGDWEAYYINGQLIDQNHSVDIWSVMAALSQVVSYAEVDGAAAETGGHFPDNLEEVVREHEE